MKATAENACLVVTDDAREQQAHNLVQTCDEALDPPHALSGSYSC